MRTNSFLGGFLRICYIWHTAFYPEKANNEKDAQASKIGTTSRAKASEEKFENRALQAPRGGYSHSRQLRRSLLPKLKKKPLRRILLKLYRSRPLPK